MERESPDDKGPKRRNNLLQCMDFIWLPTQTKATTDTFKIRQPWKSAQTSIGSSDNHHTAS